MKTLLLSISCFLSLCVSTFAQAEQKYIAHDGKTDYVIVVADDEPMVKLSKQTASHELCFYLKEITGVAFRCVPESKFDGKSPAIYVGATKYAASIGLNAKTFQTEEWAYKTVGDNLVFTGGANHGTLLGVCRFLERELGCHWFTFESSVVPKRNLLVLKNWNEQGKPAFILREIYVPAYGLGLNQEYYADYLKFAKRNRSNYFDPPMRLSHQTSTCHSFYQYVSWKEYFETHPEYFTMNEKGERIHGPSMHSEGQLCLSNPDVAQVMLTKLRGFIKKDRETLPPHAWPTVYDISQNDNFGYICKCPKCTEITKREGSESALTLTCINEVARQIRKEYPEIVIQTFAYVSTETAPKTLRPEPNVLMRWCDLYSRSDCYRPITSRFNSERKKQLDGWKAVGANIALWDYWNMGILKGPYFNPPRVETMVDAIAGDIRYYRQAGVKSFFTEAETHIHANPQNFIDLQIWLGYQLLDDPDQNEEELIQTYMKGHYGPAAKPMIAFLTELRKAVADVKHPMFYVSFSGNKRPYQTPEFFTRMMGYLQEARNLTAEGSPWRLRVEKEMITPMAVMINNPKFITAKDHRTARKQLIADYEAFRTRQIDAYCNTRKCVEFKKVLAENLEGLKYELPTPAEFKDVPENKILKFGWPVFTEWTQDPDSQSGRAMVSPDAKAYLHVMDKKGPASLFPTWFGVYDSSSKRSLQFRTPTVPTDEKYHWYDLGKFEFGPTTIAWGFFWILSANLNDVWTNADGLPGYNTWNVHISAKFTGPVYVPGSTKKNAVWIDQSVLTK